MVASTKVYNWEANIKAHIVFIYVGTDVVSKVLKNLTMVWVRSHPIALWAIVLNHDTHLSQGITMALLQDSE